MWIHHRLPEGTYVESDPDTWRFPFGFPGAWAFWLWAVPAVGIPVMCAIGYFLHVPRMPSPLPSLLTWATYLIWVPGHPLMLWYCTRRLWRDAGL